MSLRAGISVFDFWELTPKETMQVLEAAVWRMDLERNRGLSEAWHTAALVRVKRLPSLKRVIAAATPPRRVPHEELARRRADFQRMTQAVNMDKLIKRLNDGK